MLTVLDNIKETDRMTPYYWDLTRYFNYAENWGDPYRMSIYLLYYLDAFRGFINPAKLIVNCGYEG